MRAKSVFFLSVPLVGAFLALGLVIQDLKHPQAQTQACVLIGKGKALATFGETAHILFRHTQAPENDIGLTCRQAGPVLVNDTIPLPLQTGQTVTLLTRHYRWLPDRHYLSLPVVNPTESFAVSK